MELFLVNAGTAALFVSKSSSKTLSKKYYGLVGGRPIQRGILMDTA